MKNSKKSSNSLKVVIVNQPTKEKADEMINNLSKKISKIYSKKVNELEENKWKILKNF